MIIKVKNNNDLYNVSANPSLGIWDLMKEIQEAFTVQHDLCCTVWHVLPHELYVQGVQKGSGIPVNIIIYLPKTYREEAKWGHLALPRY